MSALPSKALSAGRATLVLPMRNNTEAAETVESVLNSADPALTNEEYAALRSVEEYLRALNE